MYGDNSPLDASASTAGLSLTSLDAGYLRTAGKWGRFLSIVGIILIAFFVLFMLLFGGAMLFASMNDLGSDAAAGGTFVMIIYGIVFAISLYLYILLYQFSVNAIKAADEGNPTAMTASFQSLARMFKLSGILMIIYLAFIALGFLLMIIGGAAALI